MFNKNKLRACIIASGKTVKDVANVLGINASTYYRKLAKNGAFSRSEIEILTNFLKIENPVEIFFAQPLTHM